MPARVVPGDQPDHGAHDQRDDHADRPDLQIGPGGEKTESKCPFSAMLPGAAAEPASAVSPDMQWSGQALERLGRVPEFVRPMARAGIERFARENGFREVDEQVLDRAKSFFGM
jgi:hypothetical protein